MKEKAREFAVERHGEQKYGDLPYFVHLDEVAEIASKYGDKAITVAYLHDVVEDTETELEEIENEFDSFTSKCVAVLTDEPGANRKERKAKTYDKMAKVGGELELALLVKVADRLIREGRMTEHGLVHIDAAKADTRWENAYVVSEIEVPEDFLTTLDCNPKAKRFFETLNKSSRYVIAYGLISAKKPETRQGRFEKFMAMLEREENPGTGSKKSTKP